VLVHVLVHKWKCTMKYIKLRQSTYYYRRRVPTHIAHLSGTNIIHRPLSTDKRLAMQLATRYDNLFNMIEVGLKLKQDVSEMVQELNFRSIKQKQIDIYSTYLKNLDVSDARMHKVKSLLAVIHGLLPNDIKKINMTVLDDVKDTLTKLPRRNIQKYRVKKIEELVKMDIPVEDRLANEAVNDYIKIMNSLLKFACERDHIPKQYKVSLMKKDTGARDERQALSVGSIKALLEATPEAKLRSAYALLFYSGMRTSEAYKCKISEVDGVKCFDLTDKKLRLKSSSSYRLIPIHHSIEEPEQMLADLTSMKQEYIGKKCSAKLEEGTLYSLRHSFATEMAAKGVEPHIISELLGHTHKDMTMGRYVKGFPTKLLSKAINKLVILQSLS